MPVGFQVECPVYGSVGEEVFRCACHDFFLFCEVWVFGWLLWWWRSGGEAKKTLLEKRKSKR